MSIIHREITYYLESLNGSDFCEGNFIQFNASKFEIPFVTEATKGEHSYENCSNCIKVRKRLISQIESKLKKFPLCCEHHKKLVSLDKFKVENFKGIAESTADKIMFTYHHIINFIDIDNWEKDITDYIEYTIESHGSFPSKYGEPFQLSNYLVSTLQLLNNSKSSLTSKTLSEEELNFRWKFVLNYIESYGKEKSNNTDLNVLMQTYNKWLKIFPFGLNTYFGNLKEHYENLIPIISGKPQANIYTGVVTAKLHTKDSLIDELIKLTSNLLVKINALTLYQKGLITDGNKLKLELLISDRYLKLNKGYQNNSSTDEQRYRKIIKEWFRDEKKFINELMPIMTVIAQNNEEVSVPTLFENPYEKIFKSNLGFTIYQKLHENFKDSVKYLANYSFIFYALQKDDFIICKGSDFKRFLSEHYDIHIEKIDARQIGTNSKMKLYNAIKEVSTKKARF